MESDEGSRQETVGQAYRRRSNGQRDQLVGKIQERYGIAKEEADKQVKTWEPMKTNEPDDVQAEERLKAS